MSTAAVTASVEPISAYTKDLASSSRKVREAALEKAERLLKSLPADGTDLEIRCLQLWKGLYSSLWMADRPKPQQHLAERLADLPDFVSPVHQITFLRAFWKTMITEWINIDSFRMNKFLYLVRCYMRSTFRLIFAAQPPVSSSTTTESTTPSLTSTSPLVAAHLAVLSDLPLEPLDPKKPNGLRLHLIDLYIDELEKQDPNHLSDISILAGPLIKISTESRTKIIRLRAKEALEDERVVSWGQAKKVEDDDEESDDSFEGFEEEEEEEDDDEEEKEEEKARQPVSKKSRRS